MFRFLKIIYLMRIIKITCIVFNSYSLSFSKVSFINKILAADRRSLGFKVSYISKTSSKSSNALLLIINIWFKNQF